MEQNSSSCYKSIRATIHKLWPLVYRHAKQITQVKFLVCSNDDIRTYVQLQVASYYRGGSDGPQGQNTFAMSFYYFEAANSYTSDNQT